MSSPRTNAGKPTINSFVSPKGKRAKAKTIAPRATQEDSGGFGALSGSYRPDDSARKQAFFSRLAKERVEHYIATTGDSTGTGFAMWLTSPEAREWFASKEAAFTIAERVLYNAAVAEEKKRRLQRALANEIRTLGLDGPGVSPGRAFRAFGGKV